MKNGVNNEQLILEAAEVEFLEKGFKNAATTAIAKRAGVTHAMLHYYYRTKEKLFKLVFQKKIQKVTMSFEMEIKDDDSLNLKEVIRNIVEKQFDFFAENPYLLKFIYNEITSNEDNRNFVLEMMLPKINYMNDFIEKLIINEVAKGLIRPVKAADLLLNIASLNAFTFMALPVLKARMPDQTDEYYNNILKERRESNVQFILSALKV